MTPKEDSYMVSQDDVLSFMKLKEIFQTGFSRIPVYGQTTDEIIGSYMHHRAHILSRAYMTMPSHMVSPSRIPPRMAIPCASSVMHAPRSNEPTNAWPAPPHPAAVP